MGVDVVCYLFLYLFLSDNVILQFMSLSRKVFRLLSSLTGVNVVSFSGRFFCPYFFPFSLSVLCSSSTIKKLCFVNVNSCSR